MVPAFLVRTSIDWVRHNPEFKDSNPYSRCEEAIRVFADLYREQFGEANKADLEPVLVNAYWDEFFHAEDPLPDEKEWRDGLIKRSSNYDSFEEWQDWFKKSYAKVYKDSSIWLSVLTTAWAHTHQFEVRFTNDSWEFLEALSYLPTSQLWRLYPHMKTVTEILRRLWQEEMRAYTDQGFSFKEEAEKFIGRAECLGFDTHKTMVLGPAGRHKEPVELHVGQIIADTVVPAGDSWYRGVDNTIFAQDHVDITALINRARYLFASRRRMLELTLEKTPDEARVQASAEGWKVDEAEAFV